MLAIAAFENGSNGIRSDRDEQSPQSMRSSLRFRHLVGQNMGPLGLRLLLLASALVVAIHLFL